MSEFHQGGLPPGWTTARLSDLIGVDGVLTDGDWVESKDQDPNGDVRLTQLADVGDGCWKDKSSRFLTSERASQLRCTFLREGDVLVARMPDPLGRACLFPGDPRPSITAVDVCIVRPGARSIDSAWLMHTINAPYFRAAIARLQSGSTRKRISKKNLCAISLPVPPPGEQERIVEAIETQSGRLDVAKDTLERVQANLKRYRASVLQAAVEGRLVPTEAELARQEGRDFEPATILLERILEERRRRWEEAELAKMREKGKEPKGDTWKAKYKEPQEPTTLELPDLPDGWAWSTVDALADVQGGLAKGKKRRPVDRVREVSYLRVANVQRGHLDLTEVKEIAATEDEIQRLALRPGDVLFNEGGDRDKLGRGWIWRGELRECIHQNHVFRARLLTADVLPEFLSWYGNSIGQAYFLAQGKQTTNLASISLSKLRSLPVPVPPFAEQCRIGERVDDLLSVEAAVAQRVGESLTRCARLREAILRWAFEGKLVDQDPGDEPASVALDRVRERREMPRGRADQVQLAEGAGA